MPERASALFAAITLLAGGCGYTSAYVPPDGLRARPVYNGNEVVMVGSSELPRCAVEVEEEYQGDYPPQMMIDSQGYWVPAPRVHVVFFGPVFFPPPFVFVPPGPHNLLLRSLLRGGGSSTGGSGKGAGMVMAFMAAVAVVASSGLAIGLAADPPEDDEDVAEGIDAVNLHNDRVREKIAECMREAAVRRESAAAPPAPVAAEPSPDVAIDDPIEPAPAAAAPAPAAAAPPPEPTATEPSGALRPSGPGSPTLRVGADRDGADPGADPAAKTTEVDVPDPARDGEGW